MSRFIDIPRCTVSHTYADVGQCIYCLRSGVDLTDEHVIPESIGGMIKLPKSSCHKCAVATHAMEGRVVSRMYGDARAHLGTRRKKNKKFGGEFRVERKSAGKTEEVIVSFEDHPGAVVTIALKQRPGILRHAPLTQFDHWGDADMGIWFAPGAQRKLAAIGGRISFNQDLPMTDFSRFLAKIAHSYAVGCIGLGNFKPFLAENIVSNPPKYMPHFIGGRPYGVPDPDHDRDLHEMMLSEVPHPTLPHLWMVTLRLFAPLAFPIYDIVVGEVTSRSNKAALIFR